MKRLLYYIQSIEKKQAMASIILRSTSQHGSKRFQRRKFPVHVDFKSQQMLFSVDEWTVQMYLRFVTFDMKQKYQI